jgi:DNA processing protein
VFRHVWKAFVSSAASQPPEFPPADAAIDPDVLAAIRLNLVAGIGPRIQRALCDHFDSPAHVLDATPQELQAVPGVGPKLVSAIVEARATDAAEREVARCREAGIRLILSSDADYPRMLGEICDAPQVLYCRGEMQPRDHLAIAIVGSRRCTVYGRQQAERLADGLSRAGVTIVSGLARGIDSAAHRGALSAGGRTLAVMATGLAHMYPPEHADLASEVAAHGALISESRLEQPPVAGLFPQRNRIISGLSLGVIIVEASRRSGALHTARHAMEQGREVFAVPGRIDSLASEGCHDLIRDGATLVRGVDDVLESLGPLVEPVKTDGEAAVHDPRELTLNDQERAVLAHVPLDATHVDEIVRNAGMESSRVLATLTVLEMKRMIRRLPGGYYVRGR